MPQIEDLAGAVDPDGLVAEDVLEKLVDLLILGEKTVAADVETETVAFDSARDATDLVAHLEDDGVLLIFT